MQGRITEKLGRDYYVLDTGYGSIRFYSPTPLDVGYIVTVTDTGGGILAFTHKKVQYAPENIPTIKVG